MSIVDAIIQEYEHEAANTRRTLERVPEERFGWRPHQKSMTLGQLASHIVETPTWTPVIVQTDVFELKREAYTPFLAANRAELLKSHDDNVAEAIRALTGQSDAHMLAVWSMKVEGKVVMELPRVAVVRSMLINHTVHNRGQLTVYLRMHDVPLPSLYGPSADEQA